ncbi:lactate utilization protein [Candidatus Bathyarchaeota archaeon]|nr:lactate utilization protein [Candidatus Bathyarchaeota archaeon]
MSELIEARNWYEECRIDKTLESLKEGGFTTYYAKDKDEVVKMVLDLVQNDSLVGLGGSVTLRELGLPKILKERGKDIADHWEARDKGTSYEEVLDLRRKHINSDVFITSSNAITEDGILVNIDGGGQRVAASIFGPKHVVIIIGINKIVRDLDEGIWRAKNVAAPINAKRLNKNTPCVKTGNCEDCTSPERICNVTTIMHRKPSATNITIIMVGEKLGY